MDEPIAWLRQGISDRLAAERLGADDAGKMRCHAIAKWQQAVEKAIKSVVAALRDAGILAIEIGYRHDVDRFVKVLIRLPHAAENKTIQQHLRGLLDENTRAGIRSLDALVPRRPSPGQPPARNTEYPFQGGDANWTHPAAEDVFSPQDMQRFRNLSHRIVDRAGKIVSAIRRMPR